MRDAVERTTWESNARRLDDLFAWLNELGLRVTGSRINAYRKACWGFAAPKGNNTEGMSREDFVKRVHLAYEIQSLVRVQQAFGVHSPPGLKARLADMLKGPLYVSDEKATNSSNKARNIGFELQLGAVFAEAGLDVRFAQDADITADFAGVRVIVECKRPQSFDAVGTRLHEGLKQLAGRYSSTTTQTTVERGIVALSLGRALNQDFQILPVSKALVLRRKAESITERCWYHYRKEWVDAGHPQTIGVLLQYDFPAIIEADGLITYCSDTVLTNAVGTKPQDVAFLRQLACALGRKKLKEPDAELEPATVPYSETDTRSPQG